MTARHIFDVDDLSPEEIGLVLDLSEDSQRPPIMGGLTAGLIFEKPSTRTRNSMEVAVAQLGGHPVSMQGPEVGLGSRESAADVGRVLGSYHSVIAARVLRHETLVELASSSAAPVVNLLCDRAHPLQALADLLTLRQVWGSFEGRTLAWVGDGNNVCGSLTRAAAAVGLEIRVCSPPAYRLESEVTPAPSVSFHSDPREAVAGVDAVATDVWVSMGDESEAEARRFAFAGFTVDSALMALAKPEAVFLHCLPVHRGEEVTAEVIDGPASRAWEQARNRLHTSRGVLRFVHGDRGESS